MVYCVSTFRREQISLDGLQKNSKAVAYAVNNRPRKVLGWKTPAEVFAEQLHSLRQPGVASTD